MSGPHGRLHTRRPGKKGACRGWSGAGRGRRTESRPGRSRGRLTGWRGAPARSWRGSRGGWRRSGARPRASRTATRPASRLTAPSPRPSSGGTPRPSYLRRHAPPARPPTRGRRSPETGHQDTPGTDRGGPRGVGTPTTGERTACKGHGWARKRKLRGVLDSRIWND